MHRTSAAILLLSAGAASAQSLPWTRYYNGPVQRHDVGHSVAIGPAGVLAVTGSSEGLGSGDDLATVLFSADGQQLWAARYNGPANYTDRGLSVGIDAAGNVYSAGISWGGLRPEGGEWDYILTKHSPTGQTLWTRRYNGLGNWSESFSAMAVDAAGNAYLAGFVFKEPDQFNRYATHFHLVKYDTNGEIVWDHQLDRPVHLGAGARAIHLDAAGNVYATGVINGGDAWNNDNNIFTVKVDASGAIVYAREWSSAGFNTGNDDAYAVTADAQGNAYVAGTAMANGDQLDEHLNTVVLKYGPTGDLLWTGSMHLERGETPYAIAVDADQRVYVAGAWGNAQDDDGYVTAFGPTGMLEWTYIADEPAEWDQQGMLDIAVAQDGTIIAAGDIQRATGYDPVLFTFNAAGDLLSKTPYDFGSNSDYFYDMALAADGTLALAGARPDPLTLFDYALTKVSGPAAPASCYANCDNSSGTPMLNVLDFNCFVNAFNAGDPKANCDASTSAPTLNVLDFNCFLNRFSQGCP